MAKSHSDVNAAVEMGSGSLTAYEREYFDLHRDRYVATLGAVQEIAAGRKLRVVDIGSYPPHMFNALEALGHDVYGVTSAHEPIDHPNMARADIETDTLPWPDGFFDLVLFAEVIEHLPHSPVGALREFRRLVRPQGHIVITTPNVASARQRVRLLFGRSVMYPIDAYFEHDGVGSIMFHRHNREYTASELATLLARTDWHVDRVDDFMAYSRVPHDPRGPSRRRSPMRLAKVALHYAIPGARDNLIAVASRPA